METRNNTFRKLSSQYLFLILLFLLSLGMQAQDTEFIAQHEGQSLALGFYGDYIYFNSGGNINILEAGKNNEFTFIDRFRCGYEYVNDIHVSDDKMFISTLSSGILIFDLTDPLKPEFMSIANETYAKPRFSMIHDSLLISVGERYSVLFDITDPQEPVFLSNIKFFDNQNYTYALSNNTIYGFVQIGFSGPQYLQAYDISDPYSPVLSTELELSPNYQAPWPDDMLAKDNLLFVGFDEILKVYDISANDTIIYLTEFSVPNEICNIQLDESTAFIAMDDSGMVYYDIADIYNPILLGSYHHSTLIEEMKIHDNHIFCGLGNKGFEIVDKTDLQNSFKVYEYLMTDAVYSSHINENIAYFGMKEAGLKVVDISNILNPIELSHIESLEYIDFIKSVPGYLYCMDQSDSIIHIANVSDPNNAFKVGEILAENNWILDYCIDQNRLFMMDGLDHIQVYDLSNPETPSLLTTIQEHSSRIGVKDSIMILSEMYERGESSYESKLKLFRIENNNTLTFLTEKVLGEYSIYDPRQIIIEFPYVYVMVKRGVISLKLQTNSLVQCDEFIESGSARSITIDESKLYLSGSFSGANIFVIDKSDPYHLSVDQTIQASCTSTTPFENNLCITHGWSGYSIYSSDFDRLDEFLSSKSENFISCYPNPCNESTTISFDNPKNSFSKLEVYNLKGQVLKSIDITNKNEWILETKNFKPGVYLIKVSSNNYSIIEKLMITRI